jgi:hypothetical protein
MKLSTKIVRSTDWTTSEGKKGVTHTLAAKGRVFTLNPEDFEDKKLVIDKEKKVATVSDCVAVKDTYVDALGMSRIGWKLKPTFAELEVSEF